jgi:hypothetical protein
VHQPFPRRPALRSGSGADQKRARGWRPRRRRQAAGLRPAGDIWRGFRTDTPDESLAAGGTGCRTTAGDSMRAGLVIAALAILGSCAVQAQTSISPLAMGATSPLGVLGTNGTSGTTVSAIPLGSTEIDPGGLSPAPTLACGASGSIGSQSSGTNNTTSTSAAGTIFDGGGLDMTSGCTSSSAGATGLSTPGASSSGSVMGSSIPLGATETSSAGVSPMVKVPLPGTSTMMYGSTVPGTTSPCLSSTTSDSSSSTAGDSANAVTSASGC